MDGSTWENYGGEIPFRLPEETIGISGANLGTREVIQTFYKYNISDNLTTEDGYTSEIVEKILEVIYRRDYWCASKGVMCEKVFASFKVCYLNNGNVNMGDLYSSGENNYNCRSCCVRPVVSLVSEITLKGTGEDVGNESNMWSIVQN